MGKVPFISRLLIYLVVIDCVYINANQTKPVGMSRSVSPVRSVISKRSASSTGIAGQKRATNSANAARVTSDKALKPIPQGLDLNKINNKFGAVDGQPGVRYNKNTMTAPIDDYVVALKQNKKFENIAQQIPEILPTYTLEYLENRPWLQNNVKSLFSLSNDHLNPKNFSDAIYNDWSVPTDTRLYKSNLYKGLRFLNDTVKSSDFYTSSPLMADPFENYIIALRKEYPLVPDKVLAVYIKKFFEKQPKNAIPKKGQSFDADDLIANTKDELLIPHNSNREFDGSDMSDLQKTYITMRTIQKVNEKYKEYMSDTPVDSLSFSDAQTPAASQAVPAGGLQMVPGRQPSAKSKDFFDAQTRSQKAPASTSSIPQLKRTASFSALSSSPKLTRVPSTKTSVPSPARKSLLDVPSADDINDIINRSNEIGDINRFEANLEVDNFSGIAPSLSSAYKNQYVTNLIKNYLREDRGADFFEPVIKLRQDINALQKNSSLNEKNRIAVIKIAEDALEEMTKNITTVKARQLLDELSPESGFSVYSAVKKIYTSLADLQKAERAVSSPLSLNNPIVKQYEKMYADIQDDLLKVQYEVLSLEGNRSSIFKLDEASKAAGKRLSGASYAQEPKLKVLMQKEFNQRVKKQIDLDIEVLKKVDEGRELQENETFEKLLSDQHQKTNNQLVTSVLGDLIVKLEREESPYLDRVKTIKNSILSQSDEVDMDKVVENIEKIVKGESSEDFSEFLKKTESLQVHANVIKKLSSTIHSQNKASQAKKIIDDVSESYVKKIMSNEDRNLPKNIAALELKIKAISAGDFNLSQEVEAIKKEAGFYPSANRTQQEILKIYNQVLNRLQVKQEIETVIITIKKEAKDNATKLMDIYKNDSGQDPIITALTELMKQSENEKLKNILAAYKNDANVKRVQYDLSRLAEKEMNTVESSQLAEKEMNIVDPDNKIYLLRKNPIISYSVLIDDLYDSMEKYKDTQERITENVNKLKEKLVIDSSSLFTKNLITKKKIDDAIKALKGIKDTDTKNLRKVIEDFNEGLSEDKISEATSKDVFEGTLKKLQEESTLLVEKNLLYKGLNTAYSYTLKPVVNLFTSSGAAKSSQGSLSPADQAAMSAAAKNVFDVSARQGATAADVEGALHRVVRTVSSTNNIIGAAITAILGSPAVILIIKFAAPMFLQIQNSNLSQEQKENLTRELLNSTMQDITNEVIAQQTGADLATIQAGDAQAIGTSAALNYAIDKLDPNAKNSYQYNSPSRGNSTANINKWKTETLAHIPATTEQNYYGSNYSGTGSYPYASSSPYSSSASSSYSSVKPSNVYPSLEDLAQMESERELSAYRPPVQYGGYASEPLPRISTPQTNVSAPNWSSYPSRVTSSRLPYIAQTNLQAAPTKTSLPDSTGSYQDVLSQIMRKNSQPEYNNDAPYSFGG